MIPDDEFTRRRKSRALVTALILGGFVVLFYFMTIAKVTGQ
jgi:nitrate/TMAO reductase-like tetraheme cytochrome c subunit